MATEPVSEGYKLVPMVAQNFAYGTKTGSNTNTVIQRLFLLPVRQSLIKYFDIPYPTSEQALFPFQVAAARSSQRLFKKIDSHKRLRFNGFDDLSGSASNIDSNDVARALSTIRKVGIKAIIKTPKRSYKRENKEGKEITVIRSAEFLFPKELTILQIAQAMGSLLQQSKADYTPQTFKIVGHGNYPLIKHNDKAPLNGARVGCWLVTSVPDGLGTNEPDRRGDDPIELPALSNQINPQ